MLVDYVVSMLLVSSRLSVVVFWESEVIHRFSTVRGVVVGQQWCWRVNCTAILWPSKQRDGEILCLSLLMMPEAGGKGSRSIWSLHRAQVEQGGKRIWWGRWSIQATGSEWSLLTAQDPFPLPMVTAPCFCCYPLAAPWLLGYCGLGGVNSVPRPQERVL